MDGSKFEWVVCTTAPPAGGTIQSACDHCGHANLLHPHATLNPKLEACLACQILQVIDTRQAT